LLRALPQLFIHYLVQPENSQYFPLYSLSGPARKFSLFSSLFVIWSNQKIPNIFFFIRYWSRQKILNTGDMSSKCISAVMVSQCLVVIFSNHHSYSYASLHSYRSVVVYDRSLCST
jgi:hypothetical protein